MLFSILPLIAASALAAPFADTGVGSVSLAANASSSVDMVAATWFAGWHAAQGITPVFAVSDIPWSKYTSVVYSFASTTDDDAHVTLAEADQELLPQFVQAAHQNGAEARLAIGGWGGSQAFSYAFAPANRSATIQTILSMVSQYSLDGIDFDWEYPNKQGIGCNAVNSDDTANFLAAIQALRSEPTGVGSKLVLSAAVSLTPFVDASGAPSSDVSEFAKVLDYIEVMNYDVWGNWSTAVGPNAPLNDSCVTDPSTQAVGSAVSAVAAWTAAGMPADQIVLGVASYGHTFAVDPSTISSAQALTSYPPFNAGASQGAKFGDSWTNVSSTDQCGAFVPAGGDMDFWGLIENGFLSANGTALPGIDHAFDDCSQTDYVFNPQTGVAVSYDSPRAFTAKGQFIVQEGLRGFSMWEAGGDPNAILLGSIRSASGFEDQSCNGSED